MGGDQYSPFERGEIVFSNLVAVFLSPGHVLHELGHVVACRLLGVGITEVVLFHWPESFSTEYAGCGYVRHEDTASAFEAALISTAPLLVNTVGAALVLGLARTTLLGGAVTGEATTPLLQYYADHFRSLGIGSQLFVLGCLWTGLSFAFSGFPSQQDLRNVSRAIGVVPDRLPASRSVSSVFSHLRDELAFIYATAIATISLFGGDVLLGLTDAYVLYLLLGIPFLLYHLVQGRRDRVPQRQRGRYAYTRTLHERSTDGETLSDNDAAFLIEQLPHPDRVLRDQAASALLAAARNDASVLGTYQEQLVDRAKHEPVSTVRARLLQVLTELYDDVATPPVAALATETLRSDRTVARKSTTLLEEIAADKPQYLTEHADAMRDLLDYTQGTHRTHLLRALVLVAQSNDPAAAGDGREEASPDDAGSRADLPEVATAVVEAAPAELVPVVEPLVWEIQDGSEADCASAVRDLGHVGELHAGMAPPIVGLLARRAGDGGVERESARAVARIGDGNPGAVVSELDAVCQLVGHDAEQPRRWATRAVRNAAATVPEQLEPAVEPLCARLDDGSDSVRSAATLTLARIGEARPALIRHGTDRFVSLLDDEYGYVRSNAALALRNIAAEYPAAVEPATEQVLAQLDDPKESVRVNASAVLAQLAEEYPETVPVADTLRPLFADPSVGVRTNAAEVVATVARTHPARVVPVLDRLVAQLDDDNDDIRRFAAAALAGVAAAYPLHVQQYTDALVSALDDDEPRVREHARAGLLSALLVEIRDDDTTKDRV